MLAPSETAHHLLISFLLPPEPPACLPKLTASLPMLTGLEVVRFVRHTFLVAARPQQACPQRSQRPHAGPLVAVEVVTAHVRHHAIDQVAPRRLEAKDREGVERGAGERLNSKRQ